MRAEGLFVRLSSLGAAAQASVPAVYAWAVTVAPTALGRGASVVAKVAAVVALLMLGAGAIGERQWSGRSRSASLWGFVISCAVSWSSAPGGLSPFRMDTSRGLAGMLGWALFAFASAAPSLQTSHGAPLGTAPERGDSNDACVAERPSATPGDVGYIVGAASLAAILQSIGWRIAGAERALLVRFIALASGLALIGAATDIAMQRHESRVSASTSRRFRRAMSALVVLGILTLVGVLNVMLN